MGEAAQPSSYLPLSFKTAKEQEYIKFLRDAFETNYTQGKCQLGALRVCARHPLPHHQHPKEVRRVETDSNITTRVARALIGWLPDEGALHLLNGNMRQAVADPAQLSRVHAARAAVTLRATFPSQSDVLRELPSELSEHAEALRSTKSFAPFVVEGWEFVLADLSKVCALQPSVFTDHATARASDAVDSDWKGLASIALPLPGDTTTLPVQFDAIRQAYVISSQNPNLRVAGNMQMPVGDGMTAFGFAVHVNPSFMQVARSNGRHVLRDGYHRAIGLLEKGIRWVPVLTREFSQHDDMGLQTGLLPRQVFLGERPPMLTDYQEEVVSAEVNLPASQKLLLIQAIEIGMLL